MRASITTQFQEVPAAIGALFHRTRTTPRLLFSLSKNTQKVVVVRSEWSHYYKI